MANDSGRSAFGLRPASTSLSAIVVAQLSHLVKVVVGVGGGDHHLAVAA